MLQLTQAMAAGKLQGEELNAVLDNVQPIVANIQRYLQNVQGMPKSVTDNIKQLASDGMITAEVIKNSMFYAADETNRKFASMPLTFNDAWNSIRNISLKAFQPVLQMINGLANNRTFNALTTGAATGLSMLGNVATQAFTAASNTITWGIQAAASAFMLFGNVMWSVMPFVIGALATYGSYWLTVNGNMLINAGVASAGAARTWVVTAAQTAWAVATGRLTAAQWGLTWHCSLTPLGWLQVLLWELLQSLPRGK